MIDWKYTAREKLRDYGLRLNAIKSIPQEIEALRLQAENIKVTDFDHDRVQGGEGGREDMLLSNIQKRGELERMLELAKNQVVLAESAISVLTEDERRLLDLMYIHPQKDKMERIMDEFGLLDKRSVYRRLDNALKRFTVAYYSVSES